MSVFVNIIDVDGRYKTCRSGLVRLMQLFVQSSPVVSSPMTSQLSDSDLESSFNLLFVMRVRLQFVCCLYLNVVVVVVAHVVVVVLLLPSVVVARRCSCLSL